LPSGASNFEKHTAVISARRNSKTTFERVEYFQILDGQTARVRFLEQGEDLTYAQTHRIRNSYGYYNDVPCLDQLDDGTSCPACQSDLKDIRMRGTKGYLNLIWRGTEDSQYTRSPVYKRNDKGVAEKDANKQKIITGFEDLVWLWKSPKGVFEQVLAKDKSYKGLMSRDFLVSRKGATKENTNYFIEPAVVDGGLEPMTVADQNLAQGKFNLVNLSSPGSFEEMQQLLVGQGAVKEGTFQRESAPSENDVFSGNTPMRSSAFQR
jgi:hypothetical protein